MFTQHQLTEFKNRTAVISEDGSQLTYEKLSDLGEILFNQIGRRCLVFILCQNSIGSLIGYTSFIENKVVPVLIDTKLDKQLLSNLIKLYQPEYLWLPSQYPEKFNNFKHVFQLKDYSLLKTDFNQKHTLLNELAVLFTTSGSTGSPKLVRVSYNNLFANASSIKEYLSITSSERPITGLPMHYSFGLSIINSHLLSGATLLLTNKSLMEKEFWSFLKKEKATSFSGVPYTYEMLKKLRFFRMDLPHLKTMTQAGGKLNINIAKEFAQYCSSTDKRFFIMYGQTEATARMSYLPYELAENKPGSIGVAIPEGEFYLVDDKKNIIEHQDITGELVYKGKNVTLGYAFSASDLAKDDENNGILHTGDLAKRDDEGCYSIIGRKNRFIKLFGNRVNLDETEQILKSIINECACVGIDDKMVIYISDETRIKETHDFISQKTKINYNAFTVRFIKEIPKNNSGKTMYSKLDVE